jgi:3-oxoacyl-[acyl-carrier-protein] synthase II
LHSSSLLCIHAANEAFEDANIDASEKNIGVILGSCVGGAASIDKYYTDEIKGDGGKKEDIFKMGACPPQRFREQIQDCKAVPQIQ